ncbi:hypothetical protein DFP72DRAFT_915104 [Ephemerocybe angulata]|uniref:Uncharacterized protein n=1 Tax=Ephemerocybe angulata TaxID=980116 RepID=A0A8H6HKZ6_9AGAR|nr:hypothetical protein DFP72DRAFT_915104 [Tulosesus angulatus]
MPAMAGILRATGRKAATAVRANHHSSNAQGSGGTIHLTAPISQATHLQPISLGKTIIHSLEQIRPRTPPHKLFSSTRTLSPTVPANIPYSGRDAASRSLHTGLARSSIQSGLSLPARHALHNKAFGAGSFLPRAPISPRPPVVTQMGLGTARNFSSGRPIFQNLVDNVPIALRSLYEADLDVDFARKKTGVSKRPLYAALNKPKVARAQKMKAKANKASMRGSTVAEEKENVDVNPAAEFEQYFHVPATPAVTTYVFIPLAPTPTNRLPLSTRDASRSPHAQTGHFIPMQQVGAIHASHSRHALRVSTLFSKLDCADVWSHAGVSCSPFSGCPRKAASSGVCTFLKLEFAGWSLAEVRSVLGESGQGWCVFEEVWHEEKSGLDEEFDGYLSSAFSSPPPTSSVGLDGMRSPALIDPAQSMSAFAGSADESSAKPESIVYHDPVDGCGERQGLRLIRGRCFRGPSSFSSLVAPPSESGSGLIIDAALGEWVVLYQS